MPRANSSTRCDGRIVVLGKLVRWLKSVRHRRSISFPLFPFVALSFGRGRYLVLVTGAGSWLLLATTTTTTTTTRYPVPVLRTIVLYSFTGIHSKSHYWYDACCMMMYVCMYNICMYVYVYQYQYPVYYIILYNILYIILRHIMASRPMPFAFFMLLTSYSLIILITIFVLFHISQC